ncbi:unnamed protein product [Peniophora sp. CBMAI 1063]|nr:unnamed protein product [Peniophora sp. CBMAI 1063]
MITTPTTMISLAPSLLSRPSAHSSAFTDTKTKTTPTPLDDDMNPVAGAPKLSTVEYACKNPPSEQQGLRNLVYGRDVTLVPRAVSAQV